jgi:type IV pilus assembly protein PilX
MPSIAETRRHQPQRGAALLAVVMVLAVVSLLGLAAVQITVLSEHGARNDRDYQIAWQAAEAALLDAELDIEGQPESAYTGSRADLFNGKSLSSFVHDCGGSDTSLGLCLPSSSGEPIWLQVELAGSDTTSPSVAFGTFTGRSFPSGSGLRSAQPPRYVIEAVTDYGVHSANTSNAVAYRITAVGFGPRQQTQVVLQTVYRK